MSARDRGARRAKLLGEIHDDLAEFFPSLHLFEREGVCGEVRGTFPVLGEDGTELDCFRVRISLPRKYPRELPIAREVGGRIPWTAQRHVEPDGVACVLLPDERWKLFPIGAPFLDYLTGPLHSFFLSQMSFDIDGKWPFGEWGHGVHGIIAHYGELLGSTHPMVICGFLRLVTQAYTSPRERCPCGSGRRLAACCRQLVTDLRQKLDRAAALRSLRLLLGTQSGRLDAYWSLPGLGRASQVVRHAGQTNPVSEERTRS